MKQLRRVFLLSGVLALAGCYARPLPGGVSPSGVDAGGATGPPADANITGLHVTTSSAFPQNPPPTNVDVTLTDPAPARAVYEATLALPAFPPGRYNCPNDPGYSHTIAFMDGQAVAVTATLNSGGCRDVTISGSPPVRQSDDAFWALLAQNLGIEESTLFSLAMVEQKSATAPADAGGAETAPSGDVNSADASGPPPAPGTYEAMCQHYCETLQQTDVFGCLASVGANDCASRFMGIAVECVDLRCASKLVQPSLCLTQCDALAMYESSYCKTAPAGVAVCASPPAAQNEACRADCTVVSP